MNIKYLFSLIVLLLLTGCYPSMSGTVIDADTGKPIQGAVVLVEWTQTKGFGFTRTESYEIVEVLTDKDGKFKVSGVIKPFVDPPNVTVYKKGYVCWNSRNIFPDNRIRTDFKWDKTYTFELQHFKPEYSYYKHTSFIGSAISAWRGDKKLIKNAYDWEINKSVQEIDTKINLRLVCKVIDDESEEPIEGAIVLLRGRGTGYDRGTDEILEIVSDEEGKVVISGVFPMIVNPPHMNVYKNGYIVWDSRKLFPTHYFRKDFHWQDGYIIRLKKVYPYDSINDENIEFAKRLASDANKKGKTKLWDAIEQDTK